MAGESKIDWANCPIVQIDPLIHHGRPVLLGTRMPVDDIVDNYEAGVEPLEIAQLFELPLQQVLQVLEYAANARDASPVR